MTSDNAAGMRAILDVQKAAHIRDGAPSAELRIDRINRCISQLVKYQREICDALAADFGHRSKDQSAFTDIAGSLAPLTVCVGNWIATLLDQLTIETVSPSCRLPVTARMVARTAAMPELPIEQDVSTEKVMSTGRRSVGSRCGATTPTPRL